MDELPGVGKVLLRDGFSYETRNADYPRVTHFDDLLFTFEEQGFDGFGDFAIVGDRFSLRGGPANAVAIHVTEIVNQTIRTNHFISSPPHVQEDTPGKFFSALAAYAAGAEMPTRGGQALLGAIDESFPGLGKPKRWSILHHLEIIHDELQARGAIAFV